MRRKMIMTLAFLIGVVSVQAQAFNFECFTDGSEVCGSATYDGSLNTLIVFGVPFTPIHDLAAGFRSSDDYGIHGVVQIHQTDFRWHVNNTVNGNVVGKNFDNLCSAVTYAETLRHRIMTHNNSSYDTKTKELIVDGRLFNRDGDVFNSPNEWAEDTTKYMQLFFTPSLSWTTRGFLPSDLRGTGPELQHHGKSFAEAIDRVLEFKYRPFTHRNVTFDSRAGILDVDGIIFNKHGNEYRAPGGWADSRVFSNVKFTYDRSRYTVTVEFNVDGTGTAYHLVEMNTAIGDLLNRKGSRMFLNGGGLSIDNRYVIDTSEGRGESFESIAGDILDGHISGQIHFERVKENVWNVDLRNNENIRIGYLRGISWEQLKVTTIDLSINFDERFAASYHTFSGN